MTLNFDLGIEHTTDRKNTPVQSIWFRHVPAAIVSFLQVLDQQEFRGFYDYDTSTSEWVKYDDERLIFTAKVNL